MKSRRYRKRKPRMKRKTRRGGTIPFMAIDLWGELQDSFTGTVNTFVGAYPPQSSSILSQ